MTQALAGLVVWFITGAILWYCVPRGGNTIDWLALNSEPYVSVRSVTAIAVGFCSFFGVGTVWQSFATVSLRRGGT